MVFFEPRDQSIDRVVRRRRNVAKGSPVIGNEDPAIEALEERERVVVRQMTSSKSSLLPPGRVADRKQRDIQLASTVGERVLDEVVRIRGEGGIAGEETCLSAGIEQVHAGRAAPSI